MSEEARRVEEAIIQVKSPRKVRVEVVRVESSGKLSRAGGCRTRAPDVPMRGVSRMEGRPP